MSTRNRFIALVVSLMLLGTGLLLGPSVAAEPPPPSMLGEEFYEDSLSEFRNQACDEDGEQRIDFHLSGTATGPYPGPYTHDGAVVLGAPNAAGLRQIRSYEATFRIESGDTLVTGTMTQDPLFQSTYIGRCSHVERTEGDRTIYDEVEFSTTADYEARIETTTGTYRDTGKVYNGFGYETYNTPIQGGVSSGAGSVFYTSNGVVSIGPGPATGITLDPAAAVNPVGTSHTVTASVSDSGGQPAAPTRVLVNVRGSTTTSGSCVTGIDGTCTFSYPGPELPGADSITACADVDADSACDSGEPTAEATKAWVPPQSSTGKVTGGGQVPAPSDSNGKVAFGFQAKTKDGVPSGNCQVVDQTPARNLLLKCTDVTTLAVNGTHASLFGTATVNGTVTTYRMDVDDLGEPGRGTDRFRIQTASGYAVSGTIVAGNIQTH